MSVGEENASENYRKLIKEDLRITLFMQLFLSKSIHPMILDCFKCLKELTQVELP